ncbi:hypothetical protein CZP2022_191 [Vibrio phage C-ZP2022]|nr:hypothetical protein CZP2022_191 [Vibrio phage C-ZP2022]
MKIELSRHDRVISVSHGNEKLNFLFSVWTTLNHNPTEVIFGPTNEYLATLPEEKQQALFECYRRAESVFSDASKIKHLKTEIIAINKDLTNLLDYDHLHAWCTANANFYQDPPQPVLAGKNPPEMTYSLQEMFDLRTMCVGLKLLTPIIGSFVISTKDEIQTTQKERVTGEIVSATSMADWPPFVRFSRYIAVLAHRRQSAVPMPLRFGAAKTNLDKYLMGMSIVRRFAIARLRNTDDGNIIAYVYTFLDDKLRNLNKDSWNHKFNTSDGGGGAESIGYADHHRISEEVTKDYVVASELYLEDYHTVINHLGLNPDVTPRVENYLRLLHERIENYHIVPEIHYFLVGLVIKDIIDPRSLMIVESKPALLAVIAVACVYYENLGYGDLARLLLSRREERDPSMLTGASGTLVISHLSHSLAADLSACYPYVLEADIKAKTNPGKRSIEGLVKAVLTYDWIDAENISDIRRSIASCLIMAAQSTPQQ